MDDLTTHAAGPGRPNKTGRRVALVLALFVFALAFQGSRGLWEPDEGRYTAVALEMIRLGDFINPALHHELPHFTKPPLTYWVLASSIGLFGHNEWAVRLPLALAFVATVLLVFLMGKRLVPEKPWLAALVYATSLMPFVSANVVSTDTFLTLCETLAVCGFVMLWWDEGAAGRGVKRAILWGGFGLAFLTKGPPGLLPLLAIVPFVFLARRAKGRDPAASPRVVSLLSLLVALLVGGTWFVVVIVLNPHLLGYFLRYEVVDRVFTTVHRRNAAWYGAFEVYLPTLVVGSLPWLLPVLGGLRRIPRLFRKRFWRRLRRDEPELLFLLLWFLLPLVVFSLARSRLPLYVLPLFAPLSLLIARHLAPRFELTRSRRLWLGVWIVLLIALKATAAHVTRPEDSRRLARAIQAQVDVPYDEVAFFDHRPRYGVSLYLGVEVEQLQLARRTGTPPPRPRTDSLEEEMREGETPLFVLDRYQAGTFVLRAREAGYRAVEHGTLDKLVFYTLVPRASAASRPAGRRPPAG